MFQKLCMHQISICMCLLGITDIRVVHAIAGLCTYSLVNLLPGGHTNATGNLARRGGAATLVDAMLIVQPGHTVIAQRNAAQNHGGAVALIAGAGLALLELSSCPAQCMSSDRGSGVCNEGDGGCLSVPCNWDGGDCVTQRMDNAGQETGRVCDRVQCPIRWQTNPGTTLGGCISGCFTASCDWSRETCVEPRSNVHACPLIDAAAYASIKTAQR